MSVPRQLHQFTVGRRTCTVIAYGNPPRLRIDWTPEMPSGLSVHERREYRRHRDASIEVVARALGTTCEVAARALDEALQPMADRAAGPKDDRGSWSEKG